MPVLPSFVRRHVETAASAAGHRLLRRQGPNNQGFSGNMMTIGILAGIIGAIAITILTYTCLRRLRIQGKSPKYVPTKFLKERWQKWNPSSKYAAVRNRDLPTNTAYTGAELNPTPASTGLDRNSSVRSVMTLPAYSRVPKESEQVLGREGERGGMDTVVEFPETAEEEETRRDDQMESLYQIRQARRREINEREERRRERREARERGDLRRLEELRQESRQRAADNANGGVSVSAATLIAEHQSRGRERRVSAVAYASVGQVRHDGSRLRANSVESERGGLLSGAAPMGGRSRNYSNASYLSDVSRPHTRENSISGVSVSSAGSNDLDPVTPASTIPGERGYEAANSNTANSSPTANRFTPDESGSDDIGESRIPDPNEPPGYEHAAWGDAPSYEEALARRAASQRLAQNPRSGSSESVQSHQRPDLALPQINVSGASEPSTPISPLSPESRRGPTDADTRR